MVPAISFAYENPELDIMDRVPRNSKRDHLVNSKLICFAYLQIGVIQASAGMYTYFLILNDYGIRPGTVWSLALIKGPFPRADDSYDITETLLTNHFDKNGKLYMQSQYGNTNLLVNQRLDVDDDQMTHREVFDDDYEYIAWDKVKHGKVDIRMFYARDRVAKDWTACRWDVPAGGETTYPKFFNYSYISNWHPICYSTEALKYAQSGYLVSIVCVQWADLMICKTRNLSLSQQGMVNGFGNFGLFFETALVAILCYTPPLETALGTRAIAFPHFCVPSFSFYVAIFFYDEMRKIWLRNGM